jgi:predicted translin family RNA/ssDNA-binding protein
MHHVFTARAARRFPAVARTQRRFTIVSSASPLINSSIVCLSLLSHSPTTAFSTTCGPIVGSMPNIKPNLPLRYRDSDSNNKLDLSALSAEINAASDHRQAAYDTSRKLQSLMISIRDQIGTPQAAAALHELLEQYSDYLPHDKQSTNRQPRQANLSHVAEDLVQLAAYQHFLEHGTLLPVVDWTTDEEYLGGAVMGLTRDLQHYGLGRATVRDVPSVQAACDVVTACLDYLLQLDFRNGPLRRKYDGTKYSLKALETLLYELAITSSSSSTTTTTAPDEPARKRNRHDDDGVTTQLLLLLPTDALQALKQRMDHRDELRECLIKKCRDGQKAAKQSIFCLHRGDVDKAVALLQQCGVIIKTELLPIVTEEPPLRTAGSFAAVVEEYVEAKLFLVWLHGKDILGVPTTTDDDAAAGTTHAPTASTSGSTSTSPSGCAGVLLLPEDFVRDIGMPLAPEEYIGGLCDVTGEIGRFAVQRGTARDGAGVTHCWRTNAGILTALQSLERLPGGNHVTKKLDAVQHSVEKLERMLYEMSLSEAAGGRSVQSNLDTAPIDDGGDK